MNNLSENSLFVCTYSNLVDSAKVENNVIVARDFTDANKPAMIFLKSDNPGDAKKEYRLLVGCKYDDIRLSSVAYYKMNINVFTNK
jgi:hypothetical protein